LLLLLRFLPEIVFNLQSKSLSRIIAERHYDIDNDLFLSFLDSYNQYSCGYFEGTDDLEQAQRKKLDLICRKLDINGLDHVLDIGCGWSGLSRYIAEHHGSSVTAVNISREQLYFTQNACADLPVRFLDCDYRAIRGTFDKIVSVGMLSSVAQIAQAVEGLFVIEDWHNLGHHYDKTLMAWNEKFQKAWARLRKKFDTRFKRMWEYYLLSCARNIQVWQIVMTKAGTSASQPERLRN
jgi:cyclopropane-fatty-acyl-phospholipid synthase